MVARDLRDYLGRLEKEKQVLSNWKEGAMAFRDLRRFLAALEERGQLRRVEKEVDWNLEVGAIMRKVFDMQGPAVLFQKVKGSDFPLVSGALGTFERYAMAIGVEPHLPSIIRKAMDATSNPIGPMVVKGGPCKENMDTGDSINLYKFPVPKWHALDGGRYIGTLGVVISQDPDTGKRNAAIYRQQILGRDKVMLRPTQQLGITHRKYRQMGRPVPVATAIGLDPAIVAAATVKAVYGQDELAIAGALRGEPVELVRCETVDLEVPAHAEIVLEGHMSTNEEEWQEEGPFGEFTGYYGLPGRCPVVQLSAVTYRDNPIFQGTSPGHPPTENSTLMTIGDSAAAWNKLLRSGVPGVREVYFPPMGCANFIAVVSLERQHYKGNVRQVLEALWATASSAKWAIVVDGDIDIYDWDQVMWALATRVQPHRDVILTAPGEPAISLDPSLATEERAGPYTSGSRVGIDATTEFKGFSFPPQARPGAKEMEEVEKRWAEYGI